MRCITHAHASKKRLDELLPSEPCVELSVRAYSKALHRHRKSSSRNTVMASCAPGSSPARQAGCPEPPSGSAVAVARPTPHGTLPAHEAPLPPFSRIDTDSSACASEADDESLDEQVRKLRRELERERHRNYQLTAKLQRQTKLQGQLVCALPIRQAQWPHTAVEGIFQPQSSTDCPCASRLVCFPQQLQAEQEEEYITNKLMKRLEALKREKEELARQVEVEEEMITNALTKKLQKVKEEKVQLENQLEVEQEYIVNKLQKQLSTVLGAPLRALRECRAACTCMLQVMFFIGLPAHDTAERTAASITSPEPHGAQR